MPIYTYVCSKCKKEQEFILPAGKEQKICPFCGGKLKKFYSAPAIQFKGSGFYITDYARKSPPKDEKSEKKSSKPDPSKS